MGGFAGYYGQTSLHPVALVAVVLLAFAILSLPRRLALAPMVIAATSIPMSQRLVLGGADFTLIRLLLLAYFLRLLFRGEARGFVWDRLDTTVLVWTILGTLIKTIHYGDTGALVNRLGWSYDVLLTYFAARFLIKDWEDLLGLARFVCFLSVPIAGIFVFEWTTRYNLFSVFGGVPAQTVIRAGQLRCQGPFAHPIIAGTFWAAMLPLMWMLFRETKASRRLAYIATVAVFVIVASTASSTPVASVLAALGITWLFPWRRYRRQMWLGFFVVTALLHFVIMDQPVYHLMARVDITGGSTGWHRFVILETFIHNFSDWYLTGEHNPEKWRWQMRDITNHYINQGLQGGLLTLAAFILTIVLAVLNVGRALQRLENGNDSEGASGQWKVWLVGVAVLVHAVTFLALSYFGQMNTLWYLQLAFAGSVTASFVSGGTVTRRARGSHGAISESPAARGPGIKRST